MKQKFSIKCWVIGMYLLFGCSGCGSEESHRLENTYSLSVCGGSEQSMILDTTKVTSTCGLSACRHLYEGLFKLGENGEIEKGQIKDYKVSEDEKTYCFYLRDDIFWSDGEPVTADDFVFAWRRLISEGEGYASLLDMVAGAQSIRNGQQDRDTLGVKALDHKTLLVELEEPCEYLEYVFAFPATYPIREEIARQQTDLYATDVGKAVYNGAYQLTEWRHQADLRMVKREDYYDSKHIQAEEIVWKLYSSENTMLAAFESGDIMYSDGFPSEEAGRMKEKGLQVLPGIHTCAVMVNVGEKGADLLKNPQIRKALCLAIDRERVAKLCSMDGSVADAYTPKGIVDDKDTDFHEMLKPWYPVNEWETSCVEARKLLKEAGYPDGKDFPVLKYLVNNEKSQAMAEIIVNDWKEFLGIETITIITNTDSFWAERASGNYDLAYFSWNMDYPEVSNILDTMMTGENDAGFENVLYDLTLQRAKKLENQEERWKNYRFCETILAEELPIFPVYYGKNAYLFDDRHYENLVYCYGNFYFGYVKKRS